MPLYLPIQLKMRIIEFFMLDQNSFKEKLLNIIKIYRTLQKSNHLRKTNAL